MAKKNKENELEVINPDVVNNDKWLLSPVTFSQISGNFSMVQQRVLAGILEKVQEKMLRSINDKEDSKRFPSLFTDDEMNGDTMELEIDPSYLGIIPEHYDVLEEALKDLANIRIAFPKAYKDKMNYVVAPLFARLEIPMGNKRRKGKVRVVMLNENINDFMSMDKGYTLFLTRITRVSKKVRTPRIYQFLSSCQDIGHKKVAYEDFCRFLGIDDETARADRLNKINQQLKEKEITQKEANERLEALAKWENPFRKYNKVKSQILEPAKLELDTLTSAGVDPSEEMDITFEYEALYEGTTKRGNPSHLQFTIIKKRLALEHDNEQALKRQRYNLVNTMCERYRDLSTFDIREIMKSVCSDDFDDFRDFCYSDVAKAVERRQPDNVGAYVLMMMNNWIKERQRKTIIYEDVDDLFKDDEEQKTEANYQQHELADKWQELINNYDGPAKSLLSRVEYLGLYNGSFYVTMSADDLKEWGELESQMDDFYKVARGYLSISRLAPAIVKSIKK